MTLYLRGSEKPIQLKATVGDAKVPLVRAAERWLYADMTRCLQCRGSGRQTPTHNVFLPCPKCGGAGRGS